MRSSAVAPLKLSCMRLLKCLPLPHDQSSSRAGRAHNTEYVTVLLLKQLTMTWEDKHVKANYEMKVQAYALEEEIINCTEEVKCHEEFEKNGKDL